MSKLRGYSIHGHSIHGHTQCVHNMHLVGNLEHAPAMKNVKIIHSEIACDAVLPTNTIHSVLPVCSLHMELAIPHANT